MDIQTSAEILGKVVGQVAYSKHRCFNIQLENTGFEETRSTCIVPKYNSTCKFCQYSSFIITVMILLVTLWNLVNDNKLVFFLFLFECFVGSWKICFIFAALLFPVTNFANESSSCQ